MAVHYCQHIAYYIAYWINKAYKLDANQFILLTVLSFFLLALFISGHLVYFLFPNLGYGQALAAPFIAIIVGLGIALSNNDKK